MKTELQELEEELKRKESKYAGSVVVYFTTLVIEMFLVFYIGGLTDFAEDSVVGSMVIIFGITTFIFLLYAVPLDKEVKLMSQRFKEMEDLPASTLVKSQPDTASMIHPESPSFCPYCGNRLADMNIVYCESCGHKVK